MPRGGKRAGAGRPRGSRNKRAMLEAAILAGEGPKPLDVALRAMRALDAAGEHEKAAAIAVKIAPFFYQKFSATDQPAKPHAEQSMLPLWELKPKAETAEPALGKKVAARLEAETAGVGTEWGDLLKPDRPN